MMTSNDGIKHWLHPHDFHTGSWPLAFGKRVQIPLGACLTMGRSKKAPSVAESQASDLPTSGCEWNAELSLDIK